MKKQIITLLLLTITKIATPQKSDLRKLTSLLWLEGGERTIYEQTIFKLENGGYITNAAYKPPFILEKELKKQAEKEMWSKEKLEEEIARQKEIYPFGEIIVYIQRISLEGAKLNNFLIVIKDSTDSNEIQRNEFESTVGNLPSPDLGSNTWYNFIYVPVSHNVSNPFYIYVIDKYAEDKRSKYKFKVIINNPTKN